MQYNHKEIEEKVNQIWLDLNVPEKITELDSERKKFYLLDGPPYVNDVPHVGHIKTTVFKDVWGKFKFMQGFAVWFQPGFDCGGLPIENAVEKKLGIKSKSDIEKFGADKFIEQCATFARGNEPLWLELYKKLAAWRGWVKPYLTLDDYYKESGWWTIKKLYEKGLLVQGFRPGFWCPHCETVLSGYDVTDSYKDIEDHSIFVKFKVYDSKPVKFLLVWTTTPWTLPANVALCVHPDEKYVETEVENEILILAEKRISILDEFGKQYKVIRKFPGKDIVGMKYEPLLDIPLQKNLEHKVVASIPIMKVR
ncbi:MAG: class I tRNA ligase family protein, partial [Bacteroidota bacterium]